MGLDADCRWLVEGVHGSRERARECASAAALREWLCV
jgi:hypothetical protein